MRHVTQWLGRRVTRWLTKDGPVGDTPLCDFKRLCYELRPADVVLVEGRSRVSDVIKLVTQSPWTHSALYLGRVYDIRNPDLQDRVRFFHRGDPDEQLLLEAIIGQGTLISPVSKYRRDHLRICRPEGLAPDDAQKIVAYALRHLGNDYDMRQLLDLARFLFPWSCLPRRWRSSLFQHNAGKPTRTVCSSLLAEAFDSVDYPILPFIDRREDGTVRFFKRNPRLFAPRDFDCSPYFNIIKYPYLGIYRKLPWGDDNLVYSDGDKRFRARLLNDEHGAQVLPIGRGGHRA